jgi:hypothetical protein
MKKNNVEEDDEEASKRVIEFWDGLIRIRKGVND